VAAPVPVPASSTRSALPWMFGGGSALALVAAAALFLVRRRRTHA
jgi:hypothetical protein